MPNLWRYYLEVLRPSYWPRNLFILCGFFAAAYMHAPLYTSTALARLGVVFFCAIAISSANYILNGILDAPFDALHPLKSKRPIPERRVSLPVLWKMFAMLIVMSFPVGYFFVGKTFVISLFFFFLAGVLYNVRPFRLKDIPFVDIVAESVMVPLRFLMGWFVIVASIAPHPALILFFWSFGAMIISSRRLSEIASLGKEVAVAYRKTYASYTEVLLSQQFFLYAMMSLGTLVWISGRLVPWKFLSLTPWYIILATWLWRRAQKHPLDRKGYYGAAFIAYSIFVALFALWLLQKT